MHLSWQSGEQFKAFCKKGKDSFRLMCIKISKKNSRKLQEYVSKQNKCNFTQVNGRKHKKEGKKK